MTPEEFVKIYLPEAKKIKAKTRISLSHTSDSGCA